MVGCCDVVEGGCLDGGYFTASCWRDGGYFCSDVVVSGSCLLDLC